MHARTGSSQMKPGQMAAAISMYQETFLPILKQQKGVKALYWLTDRKTDKHTVITLWETEADMLATDSAGLLKDVLAKFESYVAAQVVIGRYEVSFQA